MKKEDEKQQQPLRWACATCSGRGELEFRKQRRDPKTGQRVSEIRFEPCWVCKGTGIQPESEPEEPIDDSINCL